MRWTHRSTIVSFEVIVVNDGSTDDTAAVATRPGVTLIDLSDNAGKGHALNVGIAAARGEFLATMDDDCVPPPDWSPVAGRCVGTRRTSTSTMLGGPILPLETDSFNRRFVEWSNPLHPQEAALHEGASLWTRVRTALLVDAGCIVLVSFISPFRSERRMARHLMADGEFIEVFVDTPLAVAETRDMKGLYKKARRGELQHFTGIDSPYEAPENADIRIDTTVTTPDEAVELTIARLASAGIVSDRA